VTADVLIPARTGMLTADEFLSAAEATW